MRFFLIICLMFYTCFPAFSSEAKLDENVNFNPQLLKLQIQQTTPSTQQQEATPQIKQGEIKPEISQPKLKAKVWKLVKGKPEDDSLILGMQSMHTHNQSHYNEENNMFGFEYKGYALTTFQNSFSERTYFAGVARKMWKKQICKNFDIDLQYKAGLMHGYGDKYPNIGGVTPLVLPMIGFNFMKVGIDLTVIPSNYPIFAVSTRVGIPKFHLPSKKTKPQNLTLNNN